MAAIASVGNPPLGCINGPGCCQLERSHISQRYLLLLTLIVCRCYKMLLHKSRLK